MDALKQNMLSGYNLAPIDYHLYTDDNFFIWTSEENSILDVKIIKTLQQFAQHHQIHIRIFHHVYSVSGYTDRFKQKPHRHYTRHQPTDGLRFRNFNSYYSTNLKESIIYKQWLRIKLTCSQNRDCEIFIWQLFNHFLNRY